ncbi:hypothetical protein R5R35_000513 [Gryllus longicercus]
MNKRQKV